MRYLKISMLALITFLSMGWMPISAEETPSESEVKQLEDVEIREQAGAPGFIQLPSKTVIEVDDITTVSPPVSVIDVLKTQATIDFRGESNLDPGVDDIRMRGCDEQRFVTAIDGLTVQKSGGRKDGNIVDYATLPFFLIKSIEVLPGPHSALYDAKSVAGVLNLITRAPARHETTKPDISLTSSYASYNTMNNTAVVEGSVDSLTYDLAYQKYMTDGYLRNNEIDINTAFSRFGYLLPHDGFVALSASFSDVDRQIPVKNPGITQPSAADYDSDYPIVEKSSFQEWQDPTWDTEARTYRLNYAQTLPIGRLKFDAYSGKETRDYSYLTGTSRYSMETDWWQEGGKLMDEFQWNENNTTTFGVDLAKLYDDGTDDIKTERVRKKGAFFQHKWGILSSVDVTIGARYEDVNIWLSNWSGTALYNTSYGKYVERQWDQFIPKSFTTWKMDSIAPWLRDTSLSAGISKFWRAPDNHGDYNSSGRPSGIWLEPEHGMGYDLILKRRLIRDITLKLDYSFYNIKDYIMSNSSYAQYKSASDGALQWSDWKINLDEVHRHGVDIELGGHLTEDLSFYLTYSWQRFFDQGSSAAGVTGLDQRAEHRASAGLRYEVGEKTTLMLDYYYQSPETTEYSNQIATGVWEFYQVENDTYHIFDLGIQYECFTKAGWFTDGVLNVYLKNALNEEYYNSSGYPATDRTIGVSFSVSI